MPTTITCGKFHCSPACFQNYLLPDNFTLSLVLGVGCPSTYVIDFGTTSYTPGLYAYFQRCTSSISQDYVQVPSSCGGGTASLSLPMQRTTVPSIRDGSGIAALYTNTTNDYYGGSAALGLTSGYQTTFPWAGQPLDTQGYAAFSNPLSGCQVPNYLWLPLSTTPFSGSLLADVTTAGGGGYVTFGAQLGISAALWFRSNCSAVLEVYILDNQSGGTTQCPANGGPIVYPVWNWTLTVPTFIVGEDYSIMGGNLEVLLSGSMPNNLNNQIGAQVTTHAGPYTLYDSTAGVKPSDMPPIYVQNCPCVSLAREYTLTVSGDCSYLNGTYTIKYGVTGDGQPNRWSVILDDGRAFYFGESLIQSSGEVLALNTPIGWANLDSVSCDPFVASGHMSYALLSGDCSCTKQVPFIPCNQSNGCPNTTQTGTLYWTVS